MISLIIKNALFWKEGDFVRGDLYIDKGVFSRKAEGEILNLSGYYIMPGFVDSHAHVLGTGLKKIGIDFSDVEDKNTFLEKIKDSKLPIVFGRQWDDRKFFPNNEILDSVGKPLVIIRKCGHMALLNRKAMELFDIEERIVKEEKLQKIWEKITPMFLDEAFSLGEEEFLKHGVTFVHSDDMYGIGYEELVEVLKKSRIRIFEKLRLSVDDLNPEFFKQLSDRVTVKGVKIFMDGSLGAKTAYISGRYKDGSNGIKLLDDETVKRYMKFCDEHEILLNIHAIGDLAVHDMLNLLKDHPGHRIIHSQFMLEEDTLYAKFASFSVQPHFFYEDQELLKGLQIKGLKYPFLEMYENGIDISFSSDSPVSPCDPKYVLEHALKMGFDLTTSIHLYTNAGARQVNMKTGKIEEGFKADFAVYERNPLKLDEDPVMVFVNGEIVWEK